MRWSSGWERWSTQQQRVKASMGDVFQSRLPAALSVGAQQQTRSAR